MDNLKSYPESTRQAKGIRYWVVATVLVTVLLVALPMLALALIFCGVDPIVVLGLFISIPGVVLVSVGLFRPVLLIHGYRTETPRDSVAAVSHSRYAAIVFGTGFIAGGIAFAITAEVLLALLSFGGAQCLLAFLMRRA